jgi:general secretion pathway protein G
MKARGFTLIEMAVVLAIIAILAAILTPIVTGYLDQARVVRATGDVKTIADAIRLFYRDTGKYPTYTAVSTQIASTVALAGPGNTPTLTGTGWSNYTTFTDLAGQMNTNFVGLSTGTQVTNPGKVAWRGPYVTAIDTDPWGNRYMVTTNNLLNAGNWAIVASAGPNGVMDASATQANTAAFSVGATDDIVAVIK